MASKSPEVVGHRNFNTLYCVWFGVYYFEEVLEAIFHKSHGEDICSIVQLNLNSK